MRPLTTTKEWPVIAGYDIEAENWVEVTLVCHVDEYGNRCAFPTLAAYLDWLYSPAFSGTTVFAHYGGRYDHRFLIAEAAKRGWDFHTAQSGGSIVLLSVTSSSMPDPMHPGKYLPNPSPRTLAFGDSYRIMPDSLKKIGDTVGLPKIDLDPSTLATKTPSEVLEYCFRDCDIVVKGLQRMRDTLTKAGADFAFTLASIAARYNRRDTGIRWGEFVVKDGHKWGPHPNTVLWDGPCYESYHGGRCDVFKRSHWLDAAGRPMQRLFGSEDSPIYWYDVVSSYPASMRELLPLYYQGFYRYNPKHSIDKFLSHCGVTDCDIYVPPAFITCLPVTNEKSGRLEFPWGYLSGKWTNIELQEAVKHGAVIRHIRGQWRFDAKPFLRKFVDRFYALRQKAITANDEFEKYAYKILLNSAYGKTVETIERRAYFTIGEMAKAIKDGCVVKGTPTMGVFMSVSQEVGPYRHTAAGSYITAYSRLKLFRMARLMHEKGAALYYCDTDSLMLDMRIPEALTGTGLGDWKLEAELKELEIILPKVYRAVPLKGKTIYKCKGCPIERKWEPEDMPLKRWEAFKNLRYDEDETAAEILGNDGVTGFVEDVNAGTLMPRRKQGPCRVCNKTGLDPLATENPLPCPLCKGAGTVPRPLVRSLRSDDKKRLWQGGESLPIYYPEPATLPLKPSKMAPKSRPTETRAEKALIKALWRIHTSEQEKINAVWRIHTKTKGG